MKITEIPVPDYEKVVHAHDPESGLRAFIAVHSTVLGPALGGMRMWPFRSEDEARTDVLRLAKGMTYKSAIAQTGLGGGKSVIIGDSRKDKTEARLRAMGRFIDSLKGMYITAEDVGTTTADMQVLRQVTRWVTGLPEAEGGSGNPAPATALGTYVGLKATVEERFGRSDLKGVRVAIQGLGQVGSRLAEKLHGDGAELYVADIVPERTAEARERYGAEVLSDAEVMEVECEVFSPSALGGILNDETIPRLRCGAVAGCANNQLLEPRHGDALHERGILYAPDFVINAGGIINVSLELDPKGYRRENAAQRIENIGAGLTEIYRISREEGIPTHVAADRLAEDRLRAGKLS